MPARFIFFHWFQISLCSIFIILLENKRYSTPDRYGWFDIHCYSITHFLCSSNQKYRFLSDFSVIFGDFLKYWFQRTVRLFLSLWIQGKCLLKHRRTLTPLHIPEFFETINDELFYSEEEMIKKTENLLLIEGTNLQNLLRCAILKIQKGKP